MGILDGLRDLLSQKSSVQKVADDPQMSAELLLVLRMIFADGEMSPEELNMLKMLCSTVFKIPEDDVPDVIRFLKDFGYETSGEQAAGMFDEMPETRRKELLVNLISMARADNQMHEKEVDLIVRVAEKLGYSGDQVRAWL